MLFDFIEAELNLSCVLIIFVVNLRQVSLCKTQTGRDNWRDLRCAYDDFVKWFYGLFCNDEIDKVINWSGVFLSAR